MLPDRWQRIEVLCQAALDHPADERVEFLDQACAGDPALRAEIESLLAAHDDDPSFLEQPVARILRRSEPDADATAEDLHVGPYRLIRSLGRGGMGQVYLAVRDDEAFTQYVAVKVVLHGLDTDDLLRRFYAERQILASLNHPNIARLFDGGATDFGSGPGQAERPYFVMEYVEGEPVTDYCDARRLSIEARLRLFRQVCAAVHHAHQNLIVHRDLKPSNILVTPEGTPKLLDFGIAKLLSPDASGYAAPKTRTGQQPLTPEYASPEQARGEPITTASDVYALGVLLYELLTGRRPYRLHGLMQQEIERVICHQEPTRPSTVVTRTDEIPLPDDTTQTITPESVSHARSTGVDRLRRRLSGDVDTIVQMAMRKEPERRYNSAEQLADDVRRHLRGLPVLAQPDTLSYRTQKFVRRHRWGVLSATVIALLLVGATTGMLIQSAQIRAQAAEVSAERDRAEQVADFLMNVFGASDPAEARGDTLTAPALLARGAERVEEELADQPSRQADMLLVISEVYSKLGRFDEAETLTRRALDLQQQVYGSEHFEVARSLSLLGSVLMGQGRYDEAEPLYREALVMYRGRRGDDHPDVAKSLVALAVLLREQGRYSQAEPLYREALSIQRSSLSPDHPDVLSTLNNLAVVLRDKGDLPAAEVQMREVLALRREVLGPDHPDVGTALNNLAVVLREQGKYDDAENYYREALDLHRRTLGDEHPTVAISLNNLGRLLRQQGDDAAAERYYEEALAMRRKLLGNDHPAVAVSLNNLAGVLRDRSAFEAAEDSYRDALTILREALGDDHPNVAIALSNLARTYYLSERLAEAEQTYRTALATYHATLPDEHPRATGAMVGLGLALTELGRTAEAESLLGRAVAIRQEHYGATDAGTAEARAALGLCLAARGSIEEAAVLLTESLSILGDEPGADQHLITQVRMTLDTLDTSGSTDGPEGL